MAEQVSILPAQDVADFEIGGLGPEAHLADHDNMSVGGEEARCPAAAAQALQPSEGPRGPASFEAHCQVLGLRLMFAEQGQPGLQQ